MSNAQAPLLMTGHSLVSFFADASEQETNDILDCLNYSEIRAGRKFDRQQDWSKWINRYQAGLYQNGFSLSGALNKETFLINEPRDLLVATRDVIRGSGHAELASLASEALGKLLSSHQMKAFFEDWFSTSRGESLQIVPCRQSTAGAVDVLVCGIHMQTESTGGSWFTRPTSTLNIRIDGGAYRYSADSYEPFREKVVDNLDRYTRIYFENLA
ncbi:MULTISPECIES: hypothetical protein [Pseudomonas syringae group]|uniref:hypothetical protein n=1 Tax=Pseudomonas syringae group TaxID=136849 RepID=UPI000F03DC25|nr:hypothetical protein [Pseudomonas viridiflava]MBD8571999.1 hypothetical protein [Pseudomonas syringae]MEE4081606.1 hypothetical protein [Pseudomonas viridiflava]MEE4181578.1 hypothetical protein [Pseudomonas viridiflava]